MKQQLRNVGCGKHKLVCQSSFALPVFLAAPMLKHALVGVAIVLGVLAVGCQSGEAISNDWRIDLMAGVQIEVDRANEDTLADFFGGFKVKFPWSLAFRTGLRRDQSSDRIVIENQLDQITALRERVLEKDKP